MDSGWGLFVFIGCIEVLGRGILELKGVLWGVEGGRKWLEDRCGWFFVGEVDLVVSCVRWCLFDCLVNDCCCKVVFCNDEECWGIVEFVLDIEINFGWVVLVVVVSLYFVFVFLWILKLVVIGMGFGLVMIGFFVWVRFEKLCKLCCLVIGLFWFGWLRFIVVLLCFNVFVEFMEGFLLVFSVFKKVCCEMFDIFKCRLWCDGFFRFFCCGGFCVIIVMFFWLVEGWIVEKIVFSDELVELLLVFKVCFNGFFGEVFNWDKGCEGVDVFVDFVDCRESCLFGWRGVKLGDCEVFVVCVKRVVGGVVWVWDEGEVWWWGVKLKWW